MLSFLQSHNSIIDNQHSKLFLAGLLAGILFDASVTALATDYVNRSPQQQQYDYFRERQQQLDIEHMRKQLDQRDIGRKYDRRPC